MNRNILIEINPGLNIVGFLPVAQLSTAYSYQFTGVGGRGGYTFKTTSALPGTFTLASNGTLSGQSGDAGDWPITVTMHDSIGNHVTETFMLRVLALPLTVSGTLSPWSVGVPWSDTLTIGGGIPAYMVAPLDIPTWMSASLSGSTITLSGTPISGWTKDTIKLQVADSGNSILIAEPSISWANLTLTGTFADGPIGVPYSSDLTIAGGNDIYSLTGGDGVPVGSLPAGLSLSIVGSALRLSGTPTAEFSTSFTASVDSGDGQSATSVQSPEMAESVSALLHFDGIDGSTTFTDETGKSWTAHAQAQIDTSQKKFGDGSGLFDGVGDYISTSSHADFGFSTGDYTVEGWIKPTSSGSYMCIFDNRSGGNQGIAVYVGRNSNGRQLTFANNSSLLAEIGVTISTTKFSHFAVCRESGTVKGFVDGALQWSVTDNRNLATTASALIAISSSNQPYNGHIDELRITKGVARYTSSFTPPTAPFQNQ